MSHYAEKAGPEKCRHAFNISLYGINLIKQLVAEHGLDCEFEESGSLVTAMDNRQTRALEHDCNTFIMVLPTMGRGSVTVRRPDESSPI